MRHPDHRIIVGLALGLALTLGGSPLALAQDAGARQKGGRDRDEASGGQETATLINHALGMAIDGSQLQLMARETVSRAASETGKRPGEQGAEAVQRLQEEARQAMQDGARLLQEAREAADRGDAPSRRLLSAADRYVTTLNALVGQPLAPTGREGAEGDRERGPADRVRDRDQGDRGRGDPEINRDRDQGKGDRAAARKDRDRDQGDRPRAGTEKARDRGQDDPGLGDRRRGDPGTLNAADIATLTVVNHAVKEAIEASHLREIGQGAAADRLREHARTMTEHGEQMVQRIAGQANPGADVGQTGGESQAPTSVHLLAQQAREVVAAIREMGDDPGPGEGRPARRREKSSRN